MLFEKENLQAPDKGAFFIKTVMENKLRTALVIYTVILTVAIVGCASTKQQSRQKNTISTNGHFFDVNPQSGEIAVVTNHSVDFYSPFNHKLVHSVEIPSAPISDYRDYLDKISFSRQGNLLYVLGWKDISIIDATTHELLLYLEDIESFFNCLRILPAEKKECIYFTGGLPGSLLEGTLKKINVITHEIENRTSLDKYYSRIALNDEQTKLYVTYGNMRRGWCGLNVYDADSLDIVGDLLLAGIPKELINGQDDEIIISYEETGFAVINTQTDKVVKSFDMDETFFGEIAFDKERNILYSPTVNYDYRPEKFQTSMIGRIDFNNYSISILENNFKFGKQIALSPDGNTLYVLSGVTIHCIDLKDYNPKILVK